MDKVDVEKKAELDDPTGLEVEFHQKFMGRADIPLSNLKVSPQVALPMNPIKVSGLAAGMLQRFDPTQMSVMATPASGRPFDVNKLEDNCYEVFHGRHRLAALQQLEKKGKLDKLMGMERKMITVHIVNVNCPTQSNYGALRGNEIQSDWVRKPHLHELVYIMEKIRQQSSQEKCQETITRFAKLLSFGADDITALNKIGNWSLSGLAAVSKCLKLFETLQTLDRQDKDFVRRKETALKKKDAIAFPNVWFRKLAKIDEIYFQERAPSVVSKELSLKALIMDYVTVMNRSNTMALIQKEFGFKTKEEIDMSFPGKFPDDKLDSFSGALIGKNYKNPKGEKLKEYCLSVIMDTEAVLKVTYKNVEDAININFSDLTKFDTVVFNVKGLKGSLIKKVENLRVANSLLSVILLFAKQEDQLKAFDLLRKSAEKSLTGPMTRRICFLKDIPDVSGD